MKIRIKIGLGILVLVAVAYFALGRNSGLFQGSIKNLPPKSLPASGDIKTGQKIALQNLIQKVDRYSNDIAQIRIHPIIQQSPLETILNDRKTRIDILRQKLANAKDSTEYDRLEHIMNHEENDLESAFSYAKKITYLPANLTTLQQDFQKFQAAASLLQQKKPAIKAQFTNLSNAATASLQSLNRSYNDKSLNNIESEMAKVRKQIIPALLKIEKEEKEMSREARKLRFNFQSLLPLAQYKAPPAFGSGMSKKFTGTKKILICMMRWQGKTPFLQPDVEAITAKVNQYVDTVSNNQLHFNFQYVESSQIWGDEPEEPMPTTKEEEILIAIEVCSESNVVWSDIDGVVVFPSFLITFGGVATKNVGFTDLTGNPISASFTLISDAIMGRLFPEGTFIHELFHQGDGVNLGTRHANYLKCDDATTPFENCENMEYGNMFDIMGTGQRMGHLGGWYQRFFEWIGMRTVTRDETVPLVALEAATNKSKLLRIPFKQNPVCIEYRKPMAYDDFWQHAKTLKPSDEVLASWPELKQDDLSGLADMGRYMNSYDSSGCLFINICSFNDKGNPTTVLSSKIPGGPWPNTMYNACIYRNNLVPHYNDRLGMSISWIPDSSDATENTALVTIDIDESRQLE